MTRWGPGVVAIALAIAGLAYFFGDPVASDLKAGQDAVAEGRPDLAEAAFRRALSRDPDNEHAMYGIGWAWHMAGKEDQAREAFSLLLRVHPESPLGHKGLGSVWMAEGNAKEARAAFEKALAATAAAGDDNSVTIENSLALLDLTSRDGEAALKRYDTLVQTDPTRAEFHQGRAEALLLLSRDEEARAAADEAVRTSEEGGGRVQALALLTRARTLLAVSGGRVDGAKCVETAPPVYAWLEQADKDLDAAQALGLALPAIQGVRRTVLDRRGHVDDTCPGQRVVHLPAGAGK